MYFVEQLNVGRRCDGSDRSERVLGSTVEQTVAQCSHLSAMEQHGVYKDADSAPNVLPDHGISQTLGCARGRDEGRSTFWIRPL